MQIDLKPFNYLETALFVPDYSCEEKAICYGITGGVAKYISMFDLTKVLMIILRICILTRRDSCMKNQETC